MRKGKIAVVGCRSDRSNSDLNQFSICLISSTKGKHWQIVIIDVTCAAADPGQYRLFYLHEYLHESRQRIYTRSRRVCQRRDQADFGRFSWLDDNTTGKLVASSRGFHFPLECASFAGFITGFFWSFDRETSFEFEFSY